jgi:phosphate transport system substrate-binding protein
MGLVAHGLTSHRTRWFLLCAILLLAGCRDASVVSARPVTISIGGATAMQPVLHELSAEFSRRYPTVLFDLRGGGSQLGEAQALAGRANLGASVLPPPAEDKTARDQQRNPSPAEADLVRIPIGIDALAIVVHASNPVEMLSQEQLALIFSGRILNWVEVGGMDADTALVSREDGSGARHIFEERIMSSTAVALTAVVMPTSRDVVEYVAKTPSAVGYVSRAYVLGQLPDNGEAPSVDDTRFEILTDFPNVRVVGLEGMWPVDAALQNQIYLLSYPVYLVSRREPVGAVRQFVDFILSPAGQSIVGRYHVRVR